MFWVNRTMIPNNKKITSRYLEAKKMNNKITIRYENEHMKKCIFRKMFMNIKKFIALKKPLLHQLFDLRP